MPHEVCCVQIAWWWCTLNHTVRCTWVAITATAIGWLADGFRSTCHTVKWSPQISHTVRIFITAYRWQQERDIGRPWTWTSLTLQIGVRAKDIATSIVLTMVMFSLVQLKICMAAAAVLAGECNFGGLDCDIRWPGGTRQYYKMWNTVTKLETNLRFKKQIN